MRWSPGWSGSIAHSVVGRAILLGARPYVVVGCRTDRLELRVEVHLDLRTVLPANLHLVYACTIVLQLDLEGLTAARGLDRRRRRLGRRRPGTVSSEPDTAFAMPAPTAPTSTNAAMAAIRSVRFVLMWTSYLPWV